MKQLNLFELPNNPLTVFEELLPGFNFEYSVKPWFKILKISKQGNVYQVLLSDIGDYYAGKLICPEVASYRLQGNVWFADPGKVVDFIDRTLREV